MKMYRRIVSLVLLPCVTLTQSATLFGHTHVGSQPAGDAFRPHIHLKSHTHGHTHFHGTHSHDHLHSKLNGSSETASQRGCPAEPLSDHDSDAFYITGVDAVLGARSVGKKELTATLLWTIGADNAHAFRLASPLKLLTNWPDTPPLAGCVELFYVQHSRASHLSCVGTRSDLRRGSPPLSH